MKTIHLRCATARHATLVLILFLTAPGLRAQTPETNMSPAQRDYLQMRLRALTNNPAGAAAGSPALPGSPAPQPGAPAAIVPGTAPVAGAVAPASTAAPEKEVAGYTYNYQGVDVSQVLKVYSDLMGRTLLHAQLPKVDIVLVTQSPLTRSEAIEALQAVLALNSVVVVNIGEKFVKVLSPQEAGTSGATFNDVPADQLPDLGTYVTKIVQMKYIKPSAVMNVISPLAKLKDLIPLDDNGILVMRDYAENIKRMMEMIEKIDVNVPAVYVSEVVPIRYAQAGDIANALNSLGGSGGATVSVGGSTASTPISGVANRGGTGLGAQGGANSPASQLGQRGGLAAQPSPPTGTPSSATPFQQRLLNIINTAGGGAGGGNQPIQIFGQAKIIADERSNSLLIFATRQDLDAITNVIGKLDVLLAQVLIESVIIDYSLGPNTTSLGVSAAQSPQTFSPSVPVRGAGGYNNGQNFFDFTKGLIGTNTAQSVFGNGLGGGGSYFANLGPNWNVALTAAAADSHASIIQRPRIQTSQAKAAQFFVGDTVPYVTSTYNYGGAYGNQSSYSQLSVGVELDVTPFINPDGLVVMQIAQEIDDLNGYTTISGVGQIPNTIKRTLNSEIAVRDQDTVMLGGFIKNSKSNSKSGVPFLQDLPLLGSLFSTRNSSKGREELIVLMRPTVLKTPELAAANTIKEGQRLPGVSQSAAEAGAEEVKLIEAERKKELKNPKTMADGFFNQHMPTNAPAGQSPAVPANNNTAPPL
jgi:general secretion pathway protein D